MTFLALLSLALGQAPCPAQTKACPKAECTQVHARVVTITETRGCLVRVESEDEIDMTEAEILADPADDQAIGKAGESGKNSISLGFGAGKTTPAKLTVIYKKNAEEKTSGEQITAQFFVFGPVITRCETPATGKECKGEKTCEACPATAHCPADGKATGKAVILVQASSVKCDECPAAKAAATAKCDQCPASKAVTAKVTITKCDQCPAAKAEAACAKCETTKVAVAKCDQCPASKAAVAHCDQCEAAAGTGDCATCKNCQGHDATGSCHAAGEIVQVQAVSTTVPAKAETKTTTKRRGLIRRR